MKFKIKALEQEQWERHYIIEADSREEAENKVYNNETEKEEKKNESCYNWEVDIDEIEELISKEKVL